jgi:hypothetical protein
MTGNVQVDESEVGVKETEKQCRSIDSKRQKLCC